MKVPNISFTIATASGLNNVKFFFKHLELGNWFDICNVVYDDGTIPGKPEPEIYLRAVNKIGIPINECMIYVIELKILHGEGYHKKGIKQLADYLDIQGLKKGYLVVYSFNKGKEYKQNVIN